MGGMRRIIQIVVAVIAVALFIFAIMPQFLFVVTASQISPFSDIALSPHCCGIDLSDDSAFSGIGCCAALLLLGSRDAQTPNHEYGIVPSTNHVSTWTAGDPPQRQNPQQVDPLDIDIFRLILIIIMIASGSCH